MERGAWRATVHRVVKSQTGLKQLRIHVQACIIDKESRFCVLSLKEIHKNGDLFTFINSINLMETICKSGIQSLCLYGIYGLIEKMEAGNDNTSK